MGIKWEGRHDGQRLRNDVQERDAQDAMRSSGRHVHGLRPLFTGSDNVICECCGIVDPCCTNGMCPECRQGMGIG